MRAEVERLRAESANDADQIAEMLVEIAEMERGRTEAQTTLTASRTRMADLEAKVERLEREHAQEIAAMRDVHARALEGERSAAAQARQQAAGAEARLTEVRKTMAVVGELLEELQRREELAATLRARSITQTLRALEGDAATVPSSEAAQPAPPSPGPSEPGGAARQGPEAHPLTLDMDWDA